MDIVEVHIDESHYNSTVPWDRLPALREAGFGQGISADPESWMLGEAGETDFPLSGLQYEEAGGETRAGGGLFAKAGVS